MKLNDTVYVNLHVTPKSSNTIPLKEVDVSTMRHVRNLNLADPTFNNPNEHDLFLGADVIENTLLENKTKDNGLCIRDCLFGWVLSCHVYSSGCNNVVFYMTTTLLFESEKLVLKF